MRRGCPEGLSPGNAEKEVLTKEQGGGCLAVQTSAEMHSPHNLILLLQQTRKLDNAFADVLLIGSYLKCTSACVQKSTDLCLNRFECSEFI